MRLFRENQGKLARLPSLRFLLDFDGEVETASVKSQEIPFGSIIYGDRKNRVEILCSIETNILNDDSNISWKAVPLGFRASDSEYINPSEQFIDAKISSEKLAAWLMNNPDGIYDFVADTNLLHTCSYLIPNPRMDAQIHPVISNELERQGFKSGTVLDINCGNGSLATVIMQKFPGADVYGIDGVEGNVRDYELAIGRGRAAVGNAEEIPVLLGQSHFDAIVCNTLLEKRITSYEPSVRIALESAFKHLNPDGLFIVTGHKPLFVRRTQMEDAGFDVLKTINPENLFSYAGNPKQMYVARKPVLQAH